MYEYNAKIERVVDGDTVDLIIDLGFNTSFSTRVRLADIDAPEPRTKDLDEKAKGIAATEFLASMLSDAGNMVIVETQQDSQGKYGRYIATLFAVLTPGGSLQNINKLMVNKGHAVFKQY